MRGTRMQVNFLEPNNNNIIQWVDNSLTELITNIRRNMPDNDKVGLEFRSTNFPEKPFYVSVRNVDQLSKDLVLDRLNKVLQSNQNFFLNEMLDIFITHIKC
jgi:hypothetical protein